MNELLTRRPFLEGAQRHSLAVSTTCQVLLNDLEVMADIGALPRERGVPQPLLIYAAATVVPPATDEVGQAFDYNRIRDFALELALEPIVLIETFARRLAENCLDCDRVIAIDVRIEKPQAVPGAMAGARVSMVRRCV